MSDWFSKQEIESDILDVLVRIKIPIRAIQDGKPSVKVMSRDFRPDIIIKYEDLEDQLAETPSAYAFWSSVLAEQKSLVQSIKRKISIRRGAVKRELKKEANDLKKSGSGLSRAGLNRDDIEDLMSLDDDLKQYESDLIKAERIESKLFGIVQAIRMKAELMRSLAGFKKQEMEDAKLMR